MNSFHMGFVFNLGSAIGSTRLTCRLNFESTVDPVVDMFVPTMTDQSSVLRSSSSTWLVILMEKTVENLFTRFIHFIGNFFV